MSLRALAVTCVGLAAVALAAACGTPGAGSAPDPVAQARLALAEGSPKRALPLVESASEGPALVLRIRAMIGVSEWGPVAALVAKLPAGADKDGCACLLAVARHDVDAVRRCERAAATTFEDLALGDEVKVALAGAYELEHRPDAAEKALRDAAAARPTLPNRRALVDFLDRQGFVKDAVDVLEGWLAQAPEDRTLHARLGQMLERKVRGDLLDKRWAEAEAAARRILELAPGRGEIRYYLADALDGQGKGEDAKAERKRAEAEGHKAPPPVDAFPGMVPPPAGTIPAPGAAPSPAPAGVPTRP